MTEVFWVLQDAAFVVVGFASGALLVCLVLGEGGSRSHV